MKNKQPLKSLAYTATFTLLMLTTTAQAGWGELTGTDKTSIGLGILGAVLETNADTAAKKEATLKVENLDFNSVLNSEDCIKKHAEVLTTKQLRSKKAWVVDIKKSIQARCEMVYVANNERRIAEETKQREVARLEEQRRDEINAAKEKALQLQKQSDAEREYQEYRNFFAEKKAMLAPYSLNNWQPLYDAYYKLQKNGLQGMGLMHKAKNAEELANAKKFLTGLEIISKELAECQQVYMALEFPDAPKSDTLRIAKALELKNNFLMPSGYENALVMVNLSCGETPKKPYQD